MLYEQYYPFEIIPLEYEHSGLEPEIGEYTVFFHYNEHYLPTLEKLNRLARESNLSVNDYLKEVICRGWQAFHPIKEYKANSAPKEESTGNVFLDIMKDEGLL